MNTINQLLALDLSLLESARTLISPQYARVVQIAGEAVVIYGAMILIWLWLYGVYKKDNEYKKIALAIFFTIICVFILYAIINLGMHQWRPGAIEAVHGIPPLIPHPIDNSFPSGHALFAWGLIVGLYRYYRQNWIIASVILISIVTLIARVVGGVHYPGDIIAWLIFGILGALGLRVLVDTLTRWTTPLCIRIASWIDL